MEKSKIEPIKIEHQNYADILQMVNLVSIGESSPDFLEKRINELAEILPFIRTAASWMAVAMERASHAKDQGVDIDPAALRTFLHENEMLNRSQGALTALLCVAGYFKFQEEAEKEKKSKRSNQVRNKSNIKGESNARKK